MTKARALAERIARVPEPSVRLNKAVTCYGLLAMGIGAGMLMNGPLSALAHASFNSERGALLDLMKQDGLRAFLEARDGESVPSPSVPNRCRVEDVVTIAPHGALALASSRCLCSRSRQASSPTRCT